MDLPQIVKKSEDEGDLFDSALLRQLRDCKPPDGLVVRPLATTDYDNGFIELLGQLTEVGDVNKEQFLERFGKMKAAGGYYIIIVEDTNNGKVIGSATLVVEQKFIHNCALRGRVEDVVVSSDYRGKQLGKLVVKNVFQLARRLRCYKLSLDCRDQLLPFYESLGFKREAGNANQLNARFHYDSTIITQEETL